MKNPSFAIFINTWQLRKLTSQAFPSSTPWARKKKNLNIFLLFSKTLANP
jgi:hypothetical protein